MWWGHFPIFFFLIKIWHVNVTFLLWYGELRKLNRTWKQDLRNRRDLHYLFCAGKWVSIQMQLGPWKSHVAIFHFTTPFQELFPEAPRMENLETAFNIRQQATPLHPCRESAPYFSFLQLALAICFSIIYTFTHFREQGTVMQLNSKKHKHWRLPLHISFAKHMNAFAETQSNTHDCLESVKRYLLFVVSPPKFPGVVTYNPVC